MRALPGDTSAKGRSDFAYDKFCVPERLRKSAFAGCHGLYGEALQAGTPRPRRAATRSATERQ